MEVFCFFKINGRYMQLPSSLRGPFALISTRSGTRLVRDLAKCRRPQMSPRETCQPHIAVGWQVIESFAKPKGYWSKQISAQTILNKILWLISPNTSKADIPFYFGILKSQLNIYIHEEITSNIDTFFKCTFRTLLEQFCGFNKLSIMHHMIILQ